MKGIVVVAGQVVPFKITIFVGAIRNFMFDLTSLYNDHLSKMKSFVYRLTCDRDATNDICHDAFLKAMENQHQLKNSSAAKTWLFSIAYNLAIDWLRNRRRWHAMAQDEARTLAESSPAYAERFLQTRDSSSEARFDLIEHISFCFTCISKTLPIEQQVALLLKDLYDFKIDEISRILDCPKGTVKHWVFVARRSMNTIFNQRCVFVNKTGTCYQCSELNGFFNPHQPAPQGVFDISSGPDKFYKLRAQLVKAINPMESPGAIIEDEIMKVLREAIKDY